MYRLTLLLAFILVSPSAVLAQRSNTEGLRLNFHVNGTAIDADDTTTKTDSGGGAGLGLGYGFSSLFTVYLDVDGALMNAEELDEYTLAHADLGARFHFGAPRRQTVPYLNVALTGWALEYESNVGVFEATGGGITIGGGLLIFLSRVVALDLSVAGTFGSFTEAKLGNVTVDLDFDATSTRVIKVNNISR